MTDSRPDSTTDPITSHAQGQRDFYASHEAPDRNPEVAALPNAVKTLGNSVVENSVDPRTGAGVLRLGRSEER